jgi:membrane protease YdiL (CAAX protease family)
VRRHYDRAVSVQRSDFTAPRQVPGLTVAAVVVAYVAALFVIWAWLVRWPVAHAIVEATHSVVDLRLLLALVFVVFVGAVAFASRLTLADFAIRKDGLREGVVVLLAGYCGVQIVLLVVALLSGHGVHQGRGLTQPTGYVVGSIIAHVFALSVIEEAVFRGFLFRQCLVRTRDRSFRSYAIAAALAALAFSLSHIPQRLFVGLHGGSLAIELFGIWMIGLLATYLYVRSKNLMVVIALHALSNQPAPLFASPLPAQGAVGCIVLVMIVVLELRRRSQ